MSRLAEIHSDQTQQVILHSALDLLERASVDKLTLRDIAKNAGISERTIFRYFGTRDDLLDAVAQEVIRRLATPQPPRTLDALLVFPQALYSSFEANPKLTRASLHSELFGRLRQVAASPRWMAVRRLIDGVAPRCPEEQRKFAAANIRFFLTATAWQYYRFYFRFSLEETVRCAENVIREEIDAVRRRSDGSVRR